jgi:hypothetical protein
MILIIFIRLTVIARREATKQSPDSRPILDNFKPPIWGGWGIISKGIIW